MSQKNVYKGLCETCKYDASCTFHRTKELAIIQCEEFETTGSRDSRLTIATDQVVPMDAAEVARLGLCANCANVASCRFPNARNRVLMCEEYTLEDSPGTAETTYKPSPEAVAV